FFFAAGAMLASHYITARERMGRYRIGPSMQAPMSKIMNASTFSCGDSCMMFDVQPPDGNAVLVVERSPDATWMSENTTRPQRSSGATSSGVVNDRYCTDGWLLAVVSR